MNRFKKGDKVLCVDTQYCGSSNAIIPKNTVYTILNDSPPYALDLFPVLVFAPHAFILAEKFIYDEEFNKKLAKLVE